MKNTQTKTFSICIHQGHIWNWCLHTALMSKHGRSPLPPHPIPQPVEFLAKEFLMNIFCPSLLVASLMPLKIWLLSYVCFMNIVRYTPTAQSMFGIHLRKVTIQSCTFNKPYTLHQSLSFYILLQSCSMPPCLPIKEDYLLSYTLLHQTHHLRHTNSNFKSTPI